MVVQLYRAVCAAELADLLNSGIFRPIPGSMQGKWFAESLADARQWGSQLAQLGGGSFRLIQVDIPDDVAGQMFRLASLDQIGPARYAEGDVLDLINQQHCGLAEIRLIIGGP